MRQIISFVFLSFLFLNGFAQQKIDTIPFSKENNLLVFKGKINDVEALFAYDTGAGLGVLPKALAEKTGVKPKGNKKINDSNHQKNTMDFAIIDKMHIGSYDITSINNVIYDMPFLACNEYYLLGGNAINQLNWKINFDQKVLYVSKDPFPTDQSMVKMDLKIVKNRHFTDLTIGKRKVKNCLIDFGYTGFFESSDKEKEILKLKEKNAFIDGSGFSMGLATSQTNSVSTMTLNGLKIDTVEINDLRVEIRENTSTKIGIDFFNDLSSTTILNISDKKYYLKLREKPEHIELVYGIDVYLVDGKLRIVGIKNKQAANTASFTINEELKSVNGKTSADFADECAYLAWRLVNRGNTEMILEKMNGEKIILKKQVLE